MFRSILRFLAGWDHESDKGLQAIVERRQDLSKLTDQQLKSAA